MLLGREYGTASEDGISATEAEYQQALAFQKDIIPLVDARVRDQMAPRQKTFLERICAHSYAEFNDCRELEAVAKEVTTRFIHRATQKWVRFDQMVLAPSDDGDLDLTAGWGHGGKGGVTMPGKGRLVPRDDGGFDVYLNAAACWRNVPAAVWDYTLGGYQVIKKWLSYREKSLLGRGLTSDEVRYVTEVARRLAALVALQPQLDANYQQTKAATYAWPASRDEPRSATM